MVAKHQLDGSSSTASLSASLLDAELIPSPATPATVPFSAAPAEFDNPRVCVSTSSNASNSPGSVLAVRCNRHVPCLCRRHCSCSCPCPCPCLFALAFVAGRLAFATLALAATVDSANYVHRDRPLEEPRRGVTRLTYPQFQSINIAPLFQG